jgi:hypothetical protein
LVYSLEGRALAGSLATIYVLIARALGGETGRAKIQANISECNSLLDHGGATTLLHHEPTIGVREFAGAKKSTSITNYDDFTGTSAERFRTGPHAKH